MAHCWDGVMCTICMSYMMVWPVCDSTCFVYTIKAIWTFDLHKIWLYWWIWMVVNLHGMLKWNSYDMCLMIGTRTRRWQANRRLPMVKWSNVLASCYLDARHQCGLHIYIYYLIPAVIFPECRRCVSNCNVGWTLLRTLDDEADTTRAPRYPDSQTQPTH